MSSETTKDGEDASHAKTPLERVHEQQAHQKQTLAAGRAEAEGQSLKAHSDDLEAHPDATPDVPGAGPPSAARNFPQRRNQSHGQ